MDIIYSENAAAFRLLSTVLASGSCFILAYLAYRRNAGAKVNRAFAAFNLTLGVWVLSDLAAFFDGPIPRILTVRWAYLIGLFTAPLFVSVCRRLIGQAGLPGRVRAALWVSTGLLAPLTQTTWVVKTVRLPPAYGETPGVLFPLFAFYLLGWTGYGVLSVIFAYRESRGAKRNQLKYVFLSLVTMYGAAMCFVLNIFFPQVPPVFQFPIILANSLLGYAIVRYRLMDINLAFRYGTVYTVLALAIGAPFAVLIGWWTGRWSAGWVSFLAPLTGHLAAARLMPALTRVIDQLPIFRGRYESFRDVQQHEAHIRRSLTHEEWQGRLLSSVTSVLKVSRAEIVPASSVAAEPVFFTALAGHNILILDLLGDVFPPPEVQIVRERMKTLAAELCVRISDARGMLSAVLCVGAKRDGAYWNDLDLAALWNLTRVGEETMRDLQTRESWVQKERLAAIGEMATMVSHELKTPLAVIQNSTWFLSNRLAAVEDPKVRKHLGIIGAQTKSLGSLIAGILDYARSRELRLERWPVNDLVSEVLEELEIPTTVNVRTALSPELPTIAIDREEIKQAIRNVVLNAVQSIGSEGQLSLETRNRDDGGVEIRVSDTGRGIPAKDLPHVFDAFYTTRSEGTGLGLAVVRKVMDRHRGSVRIRSEEGRGTTVRLILPKNPAA